MNLIPQCSFIFDIKSNIRVRLIELHLVHKLLVILTGSNVLQIWDLEKKICVRALNLSIEQSEVKCIRFHDQETIYRLFKDRKNPLVQSVMILTTDKLFQFKYIIEQTDIITNASIGPSRCLEFVDSQYIAVGGEGIKIIDLKSNQIVKVMRGYHQRTISLLLSYKQNELDRPRIIASSVDGTMACWNADTALETPTFKFLMQKKDKSLLSANDGQEILSIAYDTALFQMITVTENYVTTWSSLNGMEVGRCKNTQAIREISYIEHWQFGKYSYLAHSKNSELFLLRITPKNKYYDISCIIDLKTHQDIDKGIKIQTMHVSDCCVALGTSHGLYTLSFEIPLFRVLAFHYSFICNLTISQSKDFVDDTQTIKKMTPVLQEKLSQYAQQNQQNILYLFAQDKYLLCTLVEFQTDQQKKWTALTRSSKVYTFQNYQWDNAEIHVSFSGRLIAVKNQNGAFVILAINNQNSDLMNADSVDTLHFLSNLELLHSGVCLSLSWAQYKEELVVIAPLNDKSQIVQIVQKVDTFTQGFFKQKSVTRTSYLYDSTYVSAQVQVYQFEKKAVLKLKYVDPAKSVFGVQNCYFFSGNYEIPGDAKLKTDVKNSKLDVGQFFELKDSMIPVGVPMPGIIHMDCNTNGSILISVAEREFTIYSKKVEFKPLETFKEQLFDMYFWEDMVFYTTNTSLKVLFVIEDEVLQIELANIQPIAIKDSAYPEIQSLKLGQKILMLYESQLVLVNQQQQVSFIDLKHPLMELFLHIQAEDFDKCLELSQKIDKSLQFLIAKLFVIHNGVEYIQYLNLDAQQRTMIDQQIESEQQEQVIAE